ncbi:hypothetical protein PPACK8108_LOCUS7783 [Phakopsora pachyrhizi]|uniref:Uncharacterized protein n=1 Tax=Phakopsora pachyrhizi TaxID=170000 RepID=A0AAV0ATK6_PHAPC|nr:hypothetical protein PPACK8108_LOCUS7783 [Phakopsora pachyrhizi]
MVFKTKVVGLRDDEDQGLSYKILKQKSTQDQALEYHQEEGKGEGVDSENPLKDVDWRASSTGNEGSEEPGLEEETTTQMQAKGKKVPRVMMVRLQQAIRVRMIN